MITHHVEPNKSPPQSSLLAARKAAILNHVTRCGQLRFNATGWKELRWHGFNRGETLKALDALAADGAVRIASEGREVVVTVEGGKS